MVEEYQRWWPANILRIKEFLSSHMHLTAAVMFSCSKERSSKIFYVIYAYLLLIGKINHLIFFDYADYWSQKLKFIPFIWIALSFSSVEYLIYGYACWRGSYFQKLIDLRELPDAMLVEGRYPVEGHHHHHRKERRKRRPQYQNQIPGERLIEAQYILFFREIWEPTLDTSVRAQGSFERDL